MSLFSPFDRLARRNPWAFELGAAAVWLAIGAAGMPLAIFYAGSAALGRYEGVSVDRIYASVWQGLGEPSVASWTVLLGPYGLYLLFKGLRVWWRAGTRAA